MPQKNHLSDDLFEAQETSTENENLLNHNISRMVALIFQSLGLPNLMDSLICIPPEVKYVRIRTTVLSMKTAELPTVQAS